MLLFASEGRAGAAQRAESSHVIYTHTPCLGMRVQAFPAHGFLANNIQPGPRLEPSNFYTVSQQESLGYTI